MQNLIPVLNKLQDVFATVGAHAVNLPQIVVVGCQSAGKSSVLEAVVGRDFLPRGAGICTRRPLVLQLIHIEDTKRAPSEWAEFLHKPGQKFTDFNEVRDEIDADTDRICGANKGVKDIPIHLKICSPNVLNLTLVDLPGLTKIAVEDQPADISQQIERMVHSYIEPENAIILAITPANQDLANSDSLISARRVDPQGNRTIGVLTKLDIMDKGTHARDVLLNKVYPLKLGYIGVVNRSQSDIVAKKSMTAAHQAESKYFSTHEAYRDIAANCGTEFLSTTLNQLLMRHIKSKLPALYAQINELLAAKRREMETYGSSVKTDTTEDREVVLFTLVSRYMEEFLSVLHGTNHQLSMTTLDGGSTLISTLIDEFPQRMLSIPSVKEIHEDKVKFLIENQGGMYRSMFFPEQSFQTLVIGEIKRLEECTVQCIQPAQKILIDIHNGVDVPELRRWRALRDSIVQIAQEGVQRASRHATAYAKNLLTIHQLFINTDHPDFKGKAQEASGAGGMKDVTHLVELTHRYYVIVRKEIIDMVPKAIYRILLDKGTEELRLELVEKLVLQGELFEDPAVAERRRSCAALINALEQASKVLTDVRKTHL
jgi:GTP-binding protein EngB required for normal cell division